MIQRSNIRFQNNKVHVPGFSAGGEPMFNAPLAYKSFTGY